jgi:hypothetical protein
VVDEAHVLWDSLSNIYKLTGSEPDIERVLNDMISDGTSDFTFKHLGSLDNREHLIDVQRLLCNDTLIFILKLDTPKELETGTPEKIWEQQLEIEATTQDLKNTMGLATVLKANSDDHQKLLMNVRLNIPFAQNQMVHYSMFDFGQMFKIGDDNKYVFSVDNDRPRNEMCNEFLSKIFPYILTLKFQLILDSNGFSKYKNHLNEINSQIQLNKSDLPALKLEKDPIMLAIRKDHLEELSAEAINIKSKLEQIMEDHNSNLLKLKSAVKKVKIDKDDIFKDLIQKFENDYSTIQKGYAACMELLDEIFSGYEYYVTEITELIEKLESDFEESTSSMAVEKPKIYSGGKNGSDIITMDKSPYKSMRREYLSELDVEPALLDSIPLEWCSCYSIIEPAPKRGIELFHDLVSGHAHFQGLWITGEDFEEFKKYNNLSKIQGYQISTEQDEEFIPPILDKIADIIEEFLSSNLHSVIYLDSIEHLIKNNDLESVFKFCNKIKDSIVLNDSIIIISINNTSIQNETLKELLKNSINITKVEVVFEDLLERIF